ncbi:MAG: DEAD/DEAH box helicase [Zoogloea sp.]|nr:DEAD/DEAH box helicase [Zoogloea sp.]
MTGIKLRPYQEGAIGKLRSAMARARRVMLYSPTGSGKTEMAFQLVLGALAKGRKVVFVANRKELVRQTSRRLDAAGIGHGILQSLNTRNLDAKVLVCSIDTVHRRGLPDDVGLIIIDEAHAVAGSVKYRELLFRYNLVPVVGLSATPFAPGLGKHYAELRGPLFEALVEAVTIRELIDLGFLVDCDVFAPADPDLAGVKTQRSIGGEIDYNETQLAEAVDKPALVGDVVKHWKRLAAGKQTVCFATNIAHSQHIAAEFVRHGVKAAHLDYHHDDDKRAEILDAFTRGEITVLSNSALLAEGWDCPSTEVMILARPTKSLIRYVQMVGRVLRPAPGKERALLLDHSGTVLRLGFATDDLPLELDDGTARTSASKKQERKASEPKACPSCKYVRPAGVHACPSCGFEPTRQSDVEVAEGELVKVAKKRKYADGLDRVTTFGGLLHIAQEKRYATSWARHKFRELFGEWPTGLPPVTAAPTDRLRTWVRSRNIAWARHHENRRG